MFNSNVLWILAAFVVYMGVMIAIGAKYMKSTKFNVLFVIAAWIIFIASGRNIYASVILMCAGAYMLVDVIGRLMKRKR